MTSPGTEVYGVVVAEHAALDLTRVRHRRLDDDLAIERSREIHRLAQTGWVLGLRNAHARPEVGRLHEHRESQAAFELAGDDVALTLPVAPQHDAIVADRQAAGREEHLGQRLVHAERGRGDAGADVGHVGELEQALDRAVFAVRSVQHRKDDVEVEARHRRFGRFGRGLGGALDGENRLVARTRHEMDLAAGTNLARRLDPRLLDDFGRRGRDRRLVGERPASVLLDADGDRLVPMAIEIGKHRRGRGERDLMFARSSTVEHANPKSFHSKRIQESGDRR